MSNSSNINIFVKGKKNRITFSISSSDFNKVLYQKQINLDAEKEPISPIKADILAIKEGLSFVKENRGNGIIPDLPVISLFTCYENNYHLCNGSKKADKFRDEVKAINEIKKDLSRWEGDHDHLKILWIPVGFKNLIE